MQKATEQVAQKHNVYGEQTGAQHNYPSFLTAFLNMSETPSEQEGQQLKDIESFLSSKEKGDELSQLKLLRDIKYRLGSGQLGESLLSKVHRYVRIRSQIQGLETEAKALEL